MDISGSLQRALAALDAGDSREAESLFRGILAQAPYQPIALQGLGKALLDQLRLEEAEFLFGEAIAVAEVPARAEYHLGLCRLLRGDYAKGWKGWERRLDVPDFGHVKPALPRWTGGKPAGSRLLVVAEQGYGDTIQFSRFLPRVTDEHDVSVTFLCPAPLLPLYRSWNQVPRTVVTDSIRLDDFDSFVSICSLPVMMDVRVADLPGDLPALSVDPEKAARWRNARPRARLVAGLCWAGRPTHPQDRTRSIPPDYLLRLRNAPDVALVGLQRPPCNTPAPAGLLDADWGPGIGDFSDLAAMMLALDAIVTVDTAAAHLAGTLGRPTCVTISYSPDWRWLLGREDSPWYPSVQLLRQPRPGDWIPVIENASAALARQMSVEE